ncbi:MAG: phosphoribosylamine--glycine ligase [Vicinamibacterales bacterium]
MRVLIVGSGGREHALAWKLAAESGVTQVYGAPGNVGMAGLATRLAVDPGDPQAVLDAVVRERIDLTVVGPELPLDRGIVDLFGTRGRLILGPSRAAAQLECSKVFAKAFMARHGIPTARYRVCDSIDEARAVLSRGELGLPVVVKADGLAAGKGVVVAADRETAEQAITAAMDDRQFGDAGSRVVLEECLTGPEVSCFALCDGTRAVPLRSAQDHKRVYDLDQGPNTGGMGAFSPSPLFDAAMQARVEREIIEPVLRGLAAEGTEYRGFLYTGLMLTIDGPKVIEFNVRFGDPEAQVVIPAVDEPLAPHLAAAAAGQHDGSAITFSVDKRVGVVLASGGYPGAVTTGLPISGLDDAGAQPGVTIFHSGTTERDGRIVTAGGRVLTVVGRGPSFESAIARAYDGVGRIQFDGMHYRRDIGAKARGIQTT